MRFNTFMAGTLAKLHTISELQKSVPVDLGLMSRLAVIEIRVCAGVGILTSVEAVSSVACSVRCRAEAHLSSITKSHVTYRLLASSRSNSTGLDVRLFTALMNRNSMFQECANATPAARVN